MPLPPLADNLTHRFWLGYTADGEEHELCFRLSSATASTDGITAATALATALKASMKTSDAFTQLRWSSAGSTVSFPLPWSSVAGTNANSISADNKVGFYSVVGRSAAGYRCRMTFFSPYVSATDGFRVSTAVVGIPANFYGAVTSQTPVFVAKNNQGVIWNAYVNTGWNAYWQRRLR